MDYRGRSAARVFTSRGLRVAVGIPFASAAVEQGKRSRLGRRSRGVSFVREGLPRVRCLDMIAIMFDELGFSFKDCKATNCLRRRRADLSPRRPSDWCISCGAGRSLVRYQDDGAALILQRAEAGSILAEASVYSDRYHCDARAESAAVTWAVARKDLRHHLESRPDSSAWSRHLAHEVQRARLHAEILSLKTVEARLSAWMTLNGALPAKGQRRRVADEIGVSSEALYREIAKRM